MRMRVAILAGVLAVLVASLAITMPARQGSACCDTIYAVTSSNLLRFDSTTPSTIDSTAAITGLQAGEIVRAIDFRPATGQLYGIGDTGQLYTIDPTTAVATPVGAPFALVDASTVSMDFNPTVDRIRVVSGADENFRLNPDTGAVVATDTNLAYDAGDTNFGANPDVLAIGYTNNFAGASVTTLFGIDNTLGILVRQGGVDGVPSPNSGTLFTIGSHGAVSAFNRVGLDVGPSGTAFAYLEAAGGVPQLYTIDLATGAATLVGGIGSAQVIVDIAAQVVPPTPTPSSAPTAVPTASPSPAGSPTPVQPAALPPTGGGGGGESDLVLVALIGVAAVLLTAGTLAYSRRRVG
jgi:hypothetical protein